MYLYEAKVAQSLFYNPNFPFTSIYEYPIIYVLVYSTGTGGTIYTGTCI